MSKYNIDKCFGIAGKTQIPLNKTMLSLAGIYTKNLDQFLKNKKDIIFKIENIEVSDGTIPVSIIMPKNIYQKYSCLFYIHGGGFVYDAQIHQYKCAVEYALNTGSIIVMPHYRLSPKYTHPILIDDCLQAWKFLISNSEKYNIDIDKIGICGDSAGGYLSARLTNHIIKNRADVLYQMLVYPVIDSSMQTKSMQEYIDTPMWNAKNNKIMWEWYYGNGEYEKSLLDEDISSLLPPTYIETAEFDCLHDEGLLYAKKLKEIGVDVTINETHRTMHGFDTIDCAITNKAISSRIQFINKQLDKCR